MFESRWRIAYVIAGFFAVLFAVRSIFTSLKMADSPPPVSSPPSVDLPPGNSSNEESLPPSANLPTFPWPPPPSSASVLLPISELWRGYTPDARYRFQDIDAWLSRGLTEAGYDRRSYFSIPDGFALVTQIEAINEDGSPKAVGERWEIDQRVRHWEGFSLTSYLRALFMANPGFYRIVVFTVTSREFTQQGDSASREDAMAWIDEGLNDLPDSIGLRPFYGDVTVLLYVFEKPQGAQEARPVRGTLPAMVHLEKSYILGGLANND